MLTSLAGVWLVALSIITQVNVGVLSPFSCEPTGKTICARLRDKGFGDSTYHGLQYLSCLSNSFIQSVSANQHGCIVRTDTYCWYPCALEERSLGTGTPSNRYPFEMCTCTTPTEGADTVPQYSMLTLPSACYSPSGMDCEWYSKCLMNAYSCFTYDWKYIKHGVAYAEALCRIDPQNFSFITYNWIKTSHSCIQAKLTALLRPYRNGTCWDLKRKMSDAFRVCFLPPYVQSDAVCGLPQNEWWAVFWTMRRPFERYPEINPHLQALRTLAGCEANVLLQNSVRIVEINYTTFDRHIENLAESLACRLGWKEDILYFPVGDLTRTCEPKMSYILVADKNAVNAHAKHDVEVLNKTLEKLLYSTSKGELDWNLYVRGKRVKIFGVRIFKDFPSYKVATHAVHTPNWTQAICNPDYFSNEKTCFDVLCSGHFMMPPKYLLLLPVFIVFNFVHNDQTLFRL